MKNLHLLPTDKPNRLHYYYYFDGQPVYGLSTTNLSWRDGRHIHITNDEEIKEGDWFLEDDIENLIFQRRNSKVYSLPDSAKKIILTTDQDLIGIQAIDDEFLEWFIKNPSCEGVEIQNDYLLWKHSNIEKLSDCYKIIIPQEKPKQETLKEAADNWVRKPVIGTKRESFIAGAKSDAARDYWFKIFKENTLTR